METKKLLLSVPEAAETLGLSRSVLYVLLMRNEIQSLRIGRARRIPVSALTEFIARRLDEAQAEAVGA